MSLEELMSAVLGSWSSILLFTVVLLSTWMYFSNPARHAPPGPVNIPFIGHIPFLFVADMNGKYFMELSQKYRSPIVSVRVLGQLRTVLNDYDLIKEVFAKRTDVMDRDTLTTELMASLENYERQTSGVTFGSGQQWRDQRRFTLRMMKEFGMGKLSGEDNIHFEASETIEAFKQYNGQPFDPQHIMTMAAANITDQIIFGKRFQYDDERAITILNCVNQFMIFFGEPVALLLPTRLGRWMFKSTFERVREVYMLYINYIREEIAEHKARFDGSVNDMIDAYLVEIETVKDKETCNENELINLIGDLFVAGAEISANALRWALLEVAIHQDVQEKVYQELNTVLPSEGVISMSGKNKTPYTEAVLCETQRLHSLAEMGLPHANISSDIQINGYTIPKNTMINANMFAVHHDRKFWKKPDEFYPENFLDEEGKVTNQERLIPFSIGRRSCAGEPLARAQLYILFATWMKTFHIKLEADDTVPDITPIGFTVRIPKPFSIRLSLRS